MLLHLFAERTIAKSPAIRKEYWAKSKPDQTALKHFTTAVHDLMPTKKGPARIYKLPRLLDNSPNVIAIINDSYEVVYANQACCDWLEVTHDELIGTRLSYGPASIDAEQRFNGICPSPLLFAAEQVHTAASPSQIHCINNGKRVFRNATFCRIETEDEMRIAALMVAGSKDCEETESETTAENWHELLAQLQRNERAIFQSVNLVGTSDWALRVRRQVAAIAANEADCLIVGPPGSGREHVARTIFYQRNLANAQLVPVHCAIADSKSIQNAIKNWVFDRRNNQSEDWLLLLDIDCLSVDAQSELLGYTQLPDFQMPIIATSSHDLISLAAECKFSRSLAMHLSVQTIGLGSLASRIEDIPLLVQAFIEQTNEQSEKQIASASDEVIASFTQYHWPRNISELKRYIVAAHENCNGSMIGLNDLPEEFEYALSASQIGYHELQPINLTQYLERIEKELITRAINQSGNNKTKASQLLGISRARLLRRSNSLQVQDSVSQDDGLISESEFKEAQE